MPTRGQKISNFLLLKVFEDYSGEEQDKYKEELESIKKRFSHTKVKRKWVSKLFPRLTVISILTEAPKPVYIICTDNAIT